mgnify:CR=1 FL=1
MGWLKVAGAGGLHHLAGQLLQQRLHVRLLTVLLHPEYPAAPMVEIAQHIAHVDLGCDDLDLQDRLEQHRLRLLCGFLECHRARNLECDVARIHCVIRTEEAFRFDIDDGIPGNDSFLQ